MLEISTYIIIFLSTIGFSFLGISILQKLFYKYDILDNPKKYWKKRKPIPYGVGIIFFILFFLISFLFIDINYKLILIWIFWGIITLISFIDDRVHVSPKIRLFIQILIWTIIGVTSIKIGYVSNIFGWVLDLQSTYSVSLLGKEVFFIPLFFTILWYVFIFNALNWTDGITGNTSTLSLVSFGVIFLLGCKLYMFDTYQWWKENAVFIMQITLILLWILLPFWLFDIREKVLMGDSGTMFLGFMLATIAIISGGKIATVLVVFWIYAVDALYVVFRRVLKWKNPLSWDFTHLHHRLLDIGISPTHVLILVSWLSFLFGITALFLDKVWKIIVFFIIVLIVVFLNKILENIKKIKYKKWR